MSSAANEATQQIIAAFGRRRTGWRVDMQQARWSDPTAGLASGDVDAALLRLPFPGQDEVRIEVLLTEPRWVALPVTHPLASADQICFRQLWDEPFVAAPEETGLWRDYHLATAERQGHPVRIGAVTDQPDAYLTAIANGDGIALVPESASRYYARTGIAYRPVTGVSPSQVGVAWSPANDSNPVVRDFGLVRESLRERGILYRLAPHLVRPVPMYMLAGDLRRRAVYRAGLTAYEALAAGRNIGYHTSVSAGRVAEAIPGFGGRSRGFRYFECQVDDARLTIEVARAAHAAGARLANHARVTGLLGDGRVTGATVTDEMTGLGFEVRARTVVNATGIWAERVADLASGSGGVHLRPSKGVHLVFAPGAVRTTAAVVAPSAAHDGRDIFIVPWEDRGYAGTTGTPYPGDLATPPGRDADLDYILAAVAGLFPGVT